MPILTCETTVRDISIYIFAISVVFNIISPISRQIYFVRTSKYAAVFKVNANGELSLADCGRVRVALDAVQLDALFGVY